MKTKAQDTINIEPFLISYEKKKIILAVILIVLALLFLLAIISYSNKDYTNISEIGITNVFSLLDRNSQLSQEISQTKNWLGFFGAFIAYFFVEGTIGYFSLVIPLLLLLWGITILRNDEMRKAVFYSNVFLGIGILFATLFGILAQSIDFIKEHREIYGIMGSFLGELSIRVLGGAGSLVLIAAMLLLTAYLVIDFNIKHFLSLPYKLLNKIYSFVKSKLFKREITESNNETENLTREEIERENKRPSVTIKEEKKQKQSIIPQIKIVEQEKEITPEPINTFDLTPEKVTKTKTKEKKIKEIPLTSEKVENAESLDKKDEKIINPWDEDLIFINPTLDLLDQSTISVKIEEDELKSNAELLRAKLKLFSIEIEKITVTPGPVVTLYEIVPSPDVRINRIVALQDDIALALAAKGIRIIAPIPGKSAIGVEIPNHKRETIYCRSILGSQTFSDMSQKYELPLALGKTTVGEIYISDLAQMPHLLMAGATGAGKSVGINTIIASLLYSKHPSDVKFVIIDPKKIELSFYKNLKKHFLAVCPDLNEEIITNSQNALTVLKSVELEMDNRYTILGQCGVKHIKDYNQKLKEGRIHSTEENQYHKMPYIIFIIDELADLMITAGRDIEEPIARISQLARAVGIHLILATQRPSVDVITGTIKANFTSRIAFQTASKIDSKTILDRTGAEQMLGKGDMLFLPSDGHKPIRLQNPFLSTNEIEKIVDFIYKQDGYSMPYQLPSIYEKKKGANKNVLDDVDDLFEEAAYLIVRIQQCTVSLLQRKLKIGFSRAGRIVDELEEAGIVGPSDGTKARLVLIDSEDQLLRLFESLRAQ